MSLASTLFCYVSAIGSFLALFAYMVNLTAKSAVAESPGVGRVSVATEHKSPWGGWATGTLVTGAGFATVGMILRAFEVSSTSEWFMPLPVSNTYETLAFFSWAIPLAYLAFERRYKLRQLGPFAAGIAFVLIAVASSPLVPQAVTPLVPALQSYWLVAHVLFVLVGEALFSVAFAAGVLTLWKSWRGASWESLKRFDEIGYRAVAIGFPLFTLGGIVFGAIWAQQAWGRYWGWDPKETWMLISWLIFAFYLHARVRWSWKDQRASWLIVLGYAATLFTWFGVNYLLSGLHSYA